MRNPFEDTKLDKERSPVLWFSTRSKKASTRGKPTYIQGTRGSGKTAILRSICTRDIYSIPTLSNQLLKNNRRMSWFGCYIRIQDTYSDFLTENKSSNNETERPEDKREYLLFCQHLELLVTTQLIKDLSFLRDKKNLRISYEKELRAIKVFFENIPVCKKYLSDFWDGEISNFKEMIKFLEQILTWLFNLSIGEKWANKYDFVAHIPGSILDNAKSSLISILKTPNHSSKEPLVLKILLDDCEALPLKAQKFLNSLVRSSKVDVSWVLAFVSQRYDTRSTIRENQTLSEADRHLDHLDRMDSKEFEALCNKICALRLRHLLHEIDERKLAYQSNKSLFSLQERLGNKQVDQLVEYAMQDSLSSEWKKIKEQALKWERFFLMFDTKSRVTPYTLSHAADRLGRSFEDYEKLIVQKDGVLVLKRSLARKQRAAYLSIFNQTGKKPLFTGFSMIIALSDNCIRDFLDIMCEIFDQTSASSSKKTALKFILAKTPIPIMQQNKAIYAASVQKFKNINMASDPYGDEVSRIIDSFGALTHSIQVDADNALNTPEINVFKIDWPKLAKELDGRGSSITFANKITKTAGNDGFLKELDENLKISTSLITNHQKVRYFRLHSLYAAKFGFSFRGGYDSRYIHEKLFADLLLSGPEFDKDKWVKKVINSITSDHLNRNQIELPL